MKIHENRLFIPMILSLCLIITSCQQILEFRVMTSGSTTPKNQREKIIFDYLYALKQKNYKHAYSLVFNEYEQGRLTEEEFVKDMTRRNEVLPAKISIGRERKRDAGDKYCGYHYVVYTITPKSKVMNSGEVYLKANSDNPKECKIAYNSAFGMP